MMKPHKDVAGWLQYNIGRLDAIHSVIPRISLCGVLFRLVKETRTLFFCAAFRAAQVPAALFGGTLLRLYW